MRYQNSYQSTKTRFTIVNIFITILFYCIFLENKKKMNFIYGMQADWDLATNIDEELSNNEKVS
jgi:hypothetical protein